jgi:hypothetical protein
VSVICVKQKAATHWSVTADCEIADPDRLRSLY